MKIYLLYNRTSILGDMMWKGAVGLRRIKNGDIDMGLAILAHDTVPRFSDHPHIYSETSQLCPLAARGRD